MIVVTAMTRRPITRSDWRSKSSRDRGRRFKIVGDGGSGGSGDEDGMDWVGIGYYDVWTVRKEDEKE